jgi:hypothetical protein
MAHQGWIAVDLDGTLAVYDGWKGAHEEAINEWCTKVFGHKLPVTCTKDYGMIALFDDRCVQVEANTGRLIGE